MTQDIRGRPPIELAQFGSSSSTIVSVALCTQATPWYGLGTSASWFLGSPLTHFYMPLGDPDFELDAPFYGISQNLDSLADVRIVCSVKVPPPARTYLYLEYASSISSSGAGVNFVSEGNAALGRVPGGDFSTIYNTPDANLFLSIPGKSPYIGISKSGTNTSPWFRLTQACRSGFTTNIDDPNTPANGDRFFRLMGRCESGTAVTVPMIGTTYVQFRPSQGDNIGPTPF